MAQLRNIPGVRGTFRSDPADRAVRALLAGVAGLAPAPAASPLNCPAAANFAGTSLDCWCEGGWVGMGAPLGSVE